ncbi:CHAD domain-containing protein [Ornithinicoccus halotolerans]|uniref:CHAD domain-containing protein n=1 Tax=Ornithinicoccus halotolerans TaxID=1748220 RepID=UPI0012957663|nr:CHAD domain-containing protein [Ornithinicoccus halotolerans]
MAAEARELLAGYLSRHARALLDLAGSLDEEGVHDSRTSARRVRATTRVSRPYLERSEAERLRAGLREYAAGLGELRDVTEAGGLLLAEVAVLPRDQRVGPVTTRVRRELRRREREARRRLRSGPPMPPVLQAQLTRWAEAVPLREDTTVTVDDLLDRTRWARRRANRAASEVEALGPAVGLARRSAGWHEVRKQAKAARFACEVLRPELGKPARRGARAWHDLTDVLGEAQDLRVARELLRECAEAARADGQDAFSYGVLDERTRAGIEERLGAAPTRLRRALHRTPQRS